MDRELSHKTIMMKKARSVAIIAIILVVLFILVQIGSNIVQPSVKKKDIRIATADEGPVESVIMAQGKVISKYEQAITAPFESRIIEIINKPGAELTKGDAILTLDNEDLLNNIKSIEDQIALKQNEIEQLKVDYHSQHDDLISQIEILDLRVEYSSAKTAQQKELHKIKASTTWDVRQAELTENISRIELTQLSASLERQKESTETRIRGLEISIRLLENDLRVQKRLLDNSVLKSESKGVLTWLKDEKGAAVRKGEIVAKVADLEEFRIEAKVSDLHSSKLLAGMPVRIEFNNQQINGYISSISPNINNGIVMFNVDLEDESQNDLRLNLRTDVYVITNFKDSSLRIKKGPFINGPGEQEVFIVNGNNAVRRDVEIGIAGIDYYEIIKGVIAGEKIIITNMDDYKHLEEVKIR